MALLAAGLALRALFCWLHPPFQGDAPLYGDLAANMLRHHVYGFTEADRIRETLIRLPGYPAFLALCFAVFGVGNYVAVLCVQVALDLVGCWVLGRLGERLWGLRAGVFVLGVAALCPFTAVYCAVAITETLSLLCISVAMLALVRWADAWRVRRGGWGWLTGLGAALACAVLLRPDQALLGAVFVPAVLWVACFGGRRRVGFPAVLRGLAPGLVASIIVLLPLGLWGARNWRVFHVVQPLAPRYATDPGEMVSYGFQRWYRTWAVEFESTLKVYWEWDGDVLHMKDLPQRAFDSPAQRAQTAQILARYNREQAATPAVDAAFGRLAEERVQAHPLRYYLVLPAARVANMWLRPRTEGRRIPVDWWRWREHPWGSAGALAYAVGNALWLVLAAIGWARWRPADAGERALRWGGAAFLIVRSLMLMTVDNSEPRYTIEGFPIVCLFAGYAVWRWWSRAGHRNAEVR